MAWTRVLTPCKKVYAAVLQSSRLSSCQAPFRLFSCMNISLSSSESQLVKAFVQESSQNSLRTFKNVAPRCRLFKSQFKATCKDQVLLQSGPILMLRRSFATTNRNFAPSGKNVEKSNTTGLIYIVAVFILMVGGSYAAVPLYKVFCQVSGLGGQAQRGHDTTKIEHMQKVDRQIRVRFNADVASSMRWNFRPQQTEVYVAPGETALAFYTAKNPTDKPIIGISTYNVLPYDAGQYFNKIQCFCFEEQRLNPNEQVDMPVFFFIDPDFAEDPKLENVSTITLSYTFFEAKEGLSLPLPGYPQPHDPKIVA